MAASFFTGSDPKKPSAIKLDVRTETHPDPNFFYIKGNTFSIKENIKSLNRDIKWDPSGPGWKCPIECKDDFDTFMESLKKGEIKVEKPAQSSFYKKPENNILMTSQFEVKTPYNTVANYIKPDNSGKFFDFDKLKTHVVHNVNNIDVKTSQEIPHQTLIITLPLPTISTDLILNVDGVEEVYTIVEIYSRMEFLAKNKESEKELNFIMALGKWMSVEHFNKGIVTFVSELVYDDDDDKPIC